MKKYMFAVALAAAALLLPDMAHASANLKTTLTTTQTNIGPAVTLISWAGGIIGSLFLITGLMKLRAHVDQPTQTPLKDGLGRLFVGSLLTSVPFIVDWMRNTTAITSGSGKYTGLATLT